MKIQIATTALFLLVVSPAKAQEERPTMTLDEAVMVARQRNPAFRRVQFGIRDAESRVLAAYGRFLPDLSVNMGWSGTRRTTTIGQDDFGGTIVENQSRTFTSSSASQGISTSLTLFDGFQNLNGVRAARKAVEAAEADVSVQELALVADVSRAFYQSLLAEKQVTIEEQLLQSAREDLGRQERLFTVASSDRVDVLTAELRVAQQDQSLERAISQAKKARLVVLRQLGTLGEVVDFEPAGDLPDVFDPAVFDGDELVAVAIAGHPSVSRSEAQLAQQGRLLAQARADRLPSITANGSYGRSSGTDGYSSLFDLNPNASRGFNFGFNISLPIFQRFGMTQSASAARVAVDQAEENAWEIRLQIEQEVRSALIDLQNAFTAFRIQMRSRDLNRTRLGLAQEQYRLGAATFIDLQRYLDDVATAERDLVNRQLDFATARVTLEQQVGRSIPRPEAQ